VGHVVPVDGGAGAGQIAGNRESHAVAGVPSTLLEPGGLHHALGAFVESTRRDPQPVDRSRHRLDEVALLEVHWVDPDFVRDLLEMQL